MDKLDWLILLGTLMFIVLYGVWRTQGAKNLQGYLMADKQMKWWAICLSIMGTQASAITFLSVPGQAYEDGMRFIQFYLGLPIAMVIISITAVPLYAKLKVYTAYEYLETRFDLRTRTLASLLFLFQRGLSTGITIYAPAIVLSTILSWSVNSTILIIGVLVIVYTVIGGTKAVSVTQNWQMAVITLGMFVAGYMVVRLMPEQIHFTEAISIAGSMGKMKLIDFSFDWNDRYNFWSGITGGLFLSLSYFGADQSQVGRYISGASVTESRLGLLFNGLLKIPMQFLILLLGVLLFVFYQFHPSPVFFNQVEVDKVLASPYANEYKVLEQKHQDLYKLRSEEVVLLNQALSSKDQTEVEASKIQLKELNTAAKAIKTEVKSVLQKADPDAEIKDTDYVFISFILHYLPHGLIGLLLAVIFSAAMSSTSAGLNALASTTCVDIYKRSINPECSEATYVRASKWFTVMWGTAAMFFAFLASMLDNLIQAVNILGSLFYGTILGIFLAAFYVSFIRSRAVFVAALLSEAIVLLLYKFTDIAFLWYNVIGCLLVLVMGVGMQFVLKPSEKNLQ